MPICCRAAPAEPNGQLSLIEVTQRHAELTATVAEQMADLRTHVDSSQDELRSHVETARLEAMAAVAERAGTENGALRRVALVRYDAFSEMSGRMSFSLALLDDNGDGVAISAITGRTDTRVYAKAVAAGEGEHDLSPEEQSAVSSAMGSSRRFRKAG